MSGSLRVPLETGLTHIMAARNELWDGQLSVKTIYYILFLRTGKDLENGIILKLLHF